MSEQAFSGPMDIVRAINDEAVDLDDYTREIQDIDEDTAELEELLYGIEADHPLMGQQVVIYGTELTASAGESGSIVPLALASHHEYIPVTGSYAGLTVRPVFDPAENAVEYRVCHTVQTGTEYRADSMFNHEQVTLLSYVLAHGAEVVPVLPKNAHSLKELQKDRVIEAFDKILIGSEARPREMIRELGKLANKILPNVEHETERNHQRISYLNATGLLSGLQVVTKEFAVGRPGSLLIDGRLQVNDSGQAYGFQPELFEAQHGYQRVGDTLKMNLPPELYLTAALSVEDVLYAPAKDIMTVMET